jgi:D-alanine-D-alanine ligase
MKNKHILVLKGGKSTEREVSLRSGAAVAAALREAGFRVTELDPAEESLSRVEEIRPDCAFIALHGIGGEDGAVQGALEWYGIPYTGPGIAASALCLDKILTKKVLYLSGVRTPDFLEIPLHADAEEYAEKAVEKLGLPLVLKACRQGSSIGTAIVKTKDEVAPAIRSLYTYGDNLLAEAFLSGMELTVPVMGNGELTVLPVIQITAQGEFYDYHSKYTPGQSNHIIPAPLSSETEAELREMAKRAYRATGCRGLARVDFMLSDKGEGHVIEINTSPGMTATSLFPDAAAHAGISFPQLVTRLVELALEPTFF